MPSKNVKPNLGSVKADSAIKEEGWLAPRPEPKAETPFQKPLNVLLDDVYCELLVLGSKRPSSEQRSSSLQYKPISAMNDIMRILGCMDCKAAFSIRCISSSSLNLYRPKIQPIKDHGSNWSRAPVSFSILFTVEITKVLTPSSLSFYAGLGATLDFHDNLIGFAYNQQTDYDPNSTPYYLDCLQGIGRGRASEALETLVAIEASKGKTSLQEVKNAYKDLGLDASFVSLDDDTIIGTFQSRISDAPRQESDLRRALRIIGQDRSSTKIQHVASNGRYNVAFS